MGKLKYENKDIYTINEFNNTYNQIKIPYGNWITERSNPNLKTYNIDYNFNTIDKIRDVQTSVATTPWGYTTKTISDFFKILIKNKNFTLNGTTRTFYSKDEKVSKVFMGAICAAGGKAGNNTNYLGGGKRTGGGGGGGGAAFLLITVPQGSELNVTNSSYSNYTITMSNIGNNSNLSYKITIVCNKGGNGINGAVECNQGDRAGGTGGNASIKVEKINSSSNSTTKLLEISCSNNGANCGGVYHETVSDEVSKFYPHIVYYLQAGGKGGHGQNDGNGAAGQTITINFSDAICNFLGLDSITWSVGSAGGPGNGHGPSMFNVGTGGKRNSNSLGGDGSYGGSGGSYYEFLYTE